MPTPHNSSCDNPSSARCQRSAKTEHKTTRVKSPLQRIFICYRREDTQDAAGRLHDRSPLPTASERVFMDIDSVPLGIDFVDHVTEQICRVRRRDRHDRPPMARDQRQERHADDSTLRTILVRAEIAAALQQKIPVIPVLVQDAEMPPPTTCPTTSVPRPTQWHRSQRHRWRAGVERLIKELDRVMKPSSGS